VSDSLNIDFAELPSLETERLILRAWRASDLEAFAALNADPEVMKHFPSVRSRSESDQWVANTQDKIRKYGFGTHAVEVKDGFGFIGMVGLSQVMFDAPFTPAVEIGWRLSRAAWGKGYASEAASAALLYGFADLELDEIVSFAPQVNNGSIAVMGKIGMKQDRDGDFIHPMLDENSELNPCALFRIEKADFLSGL